MNAITGRGGVAHAAGAGDQTVRGVHSLRRTMLTATILIVLYGLSLPILVLGRLVPSARVLESETAATSRAFESLRGESGILLNAAALARALRDARQPVARADIDSLASIVSRLRAAPRAEYSEIAEKMRGSFANSIAWTDRFTASLDEAVRAERLGEDSTFTSRLTRALAWVPPITSALDEAQRQGLADLLERQQRMRNAGSALVGWTFGWLAVGGILVWYLVHVTRKRLLLPLDQLEAGLTQLSNGDLEARIPDTGDELGRLANVFNRASDVLRRRAEEQGRFAAAGQLLADVAHEVNNPLMAILGTAEARLAGGGLDTDMQEDFEIVRDQARRGGKLLSGLLRFVRAGDEADEIVELPAVVTRAIDLMAYQFPLHRIECHTLFWPNTPPVRTAAIRLEQVLVNLLTNAVHAMMQSPGARALDVTVWQQNGFSCVTVRDSGPGVDERMRDRLFQPFATTKGDQGTGLGLYICRRIAREAGGDLTFDDEHPGAQVTLRLPSSVAPRAVPDAAKALDLATVMPLAGLNLLVVDDEDGVRTVVARYLRRQGARVREAPHGLEALNLVAAEMPDAVLLDLRMPVMDGYAFMDRVRSSYPALAERVLVLSGDLAAGANGNTPVPADRLIAKPVALGTLSKRLHDLVLTSSGSDADVLSSSSRR